MVHNTCEACDINKIVALAQIRNLWVIEDVANAIESFYKGKRLGIIGEYLWRAYLNINRKLQYLVKETTQK